MTQHHGLSRPLFLLDFTSTTLATGTSTDLSHPSRQQRDAQTDTCTEPASPSQRFVSSFRGLILSELPNLPCSWLGMPGTMTDNGASEFWPGRPSRRIDPPPLPSGNHRQLVYLVPSPVYLRGDQLPKEGLPRSSLASLPI